MKRVLAMALSIALIATLAISGTVAYLTDKDSAVNTFSVGKVSIEQYEKERTNQTTANSELQDFTQNQVLYPFVDVTPNDTKKLEQTVDGWKIQIRDESDVRNYVDKIVNVQNTSSKSSAYVRTIIAVPYFELAGTNENNAGQNWLHWNGISDTDTTSNNGWHWGSYEYTTKYSDLNTGAIAEWPGNDTGWHTCFAEINGRAYQLYVATNENSLAPGAFTAPNLVGFYLDRRVDFDPDTNAYYYVADNGAITYLGTIEEMQILVASQATQTEGFANAWQALDVSFGEISSENNPFTGSAAEIDPVEPSNTTGTDGATVYTINNEAELFWFADQVNNQNNSFAGKIVQLGNNITLTRNWTPIGQANDAKNPHGTAARFAGTFDGNGYTISGMKVVAGSSGADLDHNRSYGFFGFIDEPGAVIKNVKFDKATITAHHYAGVAVGYMTGTVSGVTVTNSTVTNTHLADEPCGDKAGAIAGYLNSGSISNCSASDCTVKGARDVGKLLGCRVSSATLNTSDCSATDVTVDTTSGCTDGSAGANIADNDNGLTGRIR